MAKDEKETPAETPKKKSKKMLIIIVAAVVLLGGGGAAAYFLFLKSSGEKKVEAPVKGAVVTLEDALTINLADAHYLKVGFTLQLTEAAGEEAPDIAEAIDIAIDQYTGMEQAELETEKGREKAKGSCSRRSRRRTPPRVRRSRTSWTSTSPSS